MELSIARSLLAARPFKPFKLVLPSDRVLEVPHPDFMSISPLGASAIVWNHDGGVDHVDLRLVVSARTDDADLN